MAARSSRYVLGALLILASGALTSCAGSVCGTGASSATDAVTGLLDARRSGDDTLCRYVPVGAADPARAVLDKLSQPLDAAGRVNVAEEPRRQMGSEYVVRVSGANGLIRDFVVAHNSGTYLVLVDAEPTIP